MAAVDVPIDEQRDQKRRLAADGVAEPAEEQRAEWPDRETERVRRQGTEEPKRRPVSGKEVRGDRRREAREMKKS